MSGHMLFARVGTRSTASARPLSFATVARHNPPRAQNRTTDGPMCTWVHQRAVPCTLVQRKKIPKKCCTTRTKLHIPSVLSVPSVAYPAVPRFAGLLIAACLFVSHSHGSYGSLLKAIEG